jgi:hypothetical protein
MNANSSRRQWPARWRAWISLLASLALAAATWAALGSSPASAATTTTVVGNGDLAPNGPWSLEPTSNTGTFGFVNGPSTPPSGVGSLSMAIDSGEHEWLNNYSYGACATGPSCNDLLTNRALLLDMNTLAYKTYRTSGSVLPTFNIEADYLGTGSSYTTFVFVPNIGSVVNDTWQTWDATNPSHGTWYSTTNTGPLTPFNCTFQSAGCNHSWSEIQSGYPGARVRFGLGPNLGTGGTYTGNIDDFTVGEGLNTIVYDFEPDCTTSCHVNAGTGNDLNTGQAADPVQTIQTGVTKVSSTGTVHVAAGTYNESVTINKGLTLRGANTGVAGTGIRAAESLVTRTTGQPGSMFNIATSAVVTIDGFRAQFNGTAAVGGLLQSVTAGNTLTFKNNLVDNSVYTNDLFNATQSTTLNLQNNKFTDIAQTGSGGTGVIAAWGATPSGAQAALNITGNTFSNLTDNDGVPALNLNTVSGTVSGNTFDDIHQYGILLADKLGNLSITSNVFNNIHNDTPMTSGSRGSGVRTFAVPNFVGPVTITHNTFSNSYHGMRIANDGSPADVPSTFKVNRNAFTNNTEADISLATGTTGTLDGTCNWWGQAGGPVSGQVDGSVTTNPFLGSSNLNGPCPPPTVPGPPRMVTAKPGNNSATVSWNPPLSNGGSPVNGYLVTPIKAGVPQPVRTFNSTATTQVITGLTNRVGYKFVVAARNAVGTGAGANSNGGVRVGAPGTPPPPTVTNTAPGKLKVTFKAPAPNGSPITSYKAECTSPNGGVKGTKSGPRSPITVSGLTAGKTYRCRVRATNARGSGTPSLRSAAMTA